MALLLFNRWDCSEVKVEDLSLKSYIYLENKIIPHNFGRHAKVRFGKAKVHIVERLANKLMRSGQGAKLLGGKYIRGRKGCGKKLNAYDIIEKAFELIEKKTGKNPIQVYVKALENAAPREDITRIKRGGITYAVATDAAPQRRLDEAIKNISLGAFSSAFNKKIKAYEALAEEIINAYNNDPKSFAIRRKDEIERIAKASR